MRLDIRHRPTLPTLLAAAVLCLAAAACGPARGNDAEAPPEGSAESAQVPGAAGQPDGPAPDGLAKATFAGGCFWCMEPPFDELEGVRLHHLRLHRRPRRQPDLRAGLLRPHRPRRVDAGGLRPEEGELREAARRLLAQRRSRLDAGGQFCDRGNQYRTAIFYHSDEQKRLAEASKAEVATKLGKTDRHARSRPRAPSTPPRTTTRTSTRRTPCATRSTGAAAAGTGA